MKRFFDIFLAIALLLFLALVFLLFFLLVRLTSKGPAIHWSKRIGRKNKEFLMPKFRSMKLDTPQLATDLLTNPEKYITPVGLFLRKTSLDELPQLFSVLIGDMSFVGPRPALFNQDQLIQMRTEAGVHNLRPGITGWAQVNGRDEIPTPVKVKLDQEYLKNHNFFLDLRIISMTFFRVLKADGVKH